MDDTRSGLATGEAWPSLSFEAGQATYATLQRWTQIVGKVRLAQAPHINHWWQVPLYVTCRGLTTASIPHGSRRFEIDFDFIDHRLAIRTSDGRIESFALQPMSVADFYREFMRRMRSLGLDVRIWSMPVEIPDPVAFEHDRDHHTYDKDQVQRLWRALMQADRVMTDFRARFVGKVSPVHFFWGAFDLAVTRFSGRAAPPHPGAPNLALHVARESYSMEVSSCGFWPGGPGLERAVFYSYAYPEPAGFKDAEAGPPAAFYSDELREFILPYDDVRRARSPDGTLLDFLQSTYGAAADLAKWPRDLERRA